MSQQLWRLDDQTKAAVLNHKREHRYVDALQDELRDFREIFWHPMHDGQRAWAEQMIKSIEHELDEIEAGRLGVPENWKG